MAPRERVFSGIQPSGEIHVGNYLGAIKNWVAMLDKYDCIFCIVDYHATTIDYDPREMPTRTFDAALVNIACGLDPGRCSLFVQSAVPEHTELCWALMIACPMGELGRMTQFKQKADQHKENVNAGLFTYPVLMAADILLYKAQRVPVGDDQVQHLELSREIARRWNARFGELFPEPLPMLSQAARVMGLDGKAKMSKSLGNHLGVLESPETTRARLKPAYTDPARLRRTDPGNPDICNVFTMHKGFSSAETIARVNTECRTAAVGCGDCKLLLAGHMDETLGPVRERAEQLRSKPQLVWEALDAGAARCRTLARETMREVRAAMGLRGPDAAGGR
jgi:tryptophanyl-tRNA synthetase